MKTNIPEQPRDISHPFYTILRNYIVRSDAATIAKEIGVSPSLISNVKAGRTRSRIAWKSLIQVAMERRQSEKDFMDYMSNGSTK